jgi:Bacterial protein of unknown function (DUF882)
MMYRLHRREDAPVSGTGQQSGLSRGTLRSGHRTLFAVLAALLATTVFTTSAHADGPYSSAAALFTRVPAPRATPAPTPPAPTVPPLVFFRAHGGATFTLTPSTAGGGFDAAAVEIARQAFAWRNDDFQSQHAVSTRLLDLVYQTMRHFNATQVEIVSGFRDGRSTSRHSHGRAIDFTIPGVTMTALAEHLRSLGFVGVGIYPRSGFVHLDVRATSYFWVDHSGAGRRGRVRQILAGVAQRADQAAIARGEAPDAAVAAAELEEKAAYASGDPSARVGRSRAARILARRQRVAEERRRIQRRERRQMRAARAPNEG